MAHTGVSKSKLDLLCREIQDYTEHMQSILNQLDTVFEQSKESFQGEISLSFYSKYKELSNSYKIIQENMYSYIDEFHSVVSKFEEQDALLAKRLDQKRVGNLEEGSDL